MNKSILVIGAGGHGKVVADAVLVSGMRLIGFLDDDQVRIGQSVLGYSVLGASDRWVDFEPAGLIMGIGSNPIRQQLQERIAVVASADWVKVVHPRAIIASSAQIGRGTFIAAGAVINPDTVVGQHTIINTGATVDHDCIIGDYVHIAPGAHLAGGVWVGDSALIGIGSVVLPGCRIGKNTVIGAGAVVVKDIPEGVVAKGIPARWNE